MLLLFLGFVVFVSVATAVFAFGTAIVTPSSTLGARLRALGGQQQQPEYRASFRERLEQALEPISKALPLSPADTTRTRAWLMQAGFRDAIDVNYYFGARLLMAGIGFVGVALFAGFDNLLLLVGIPALGFFLPRFILKRMIKDRQHRITLGLADALDLTVICVEAGLALDQALTRVGQDLHHAHPDLSDEFHLVNLEMRAGKPSECIPTLSARNAANGPKSKRQKPRSRWSPHWWYLFCLRLFLSRSARPLSS